MRMTMVKNVTMTVSLCNEAGHVIRLVSVPPAMIADAGVLKVGRDFYKRTSGLRYTRTKVVELSLDPALIG